MPAVVTRATYNIQQKTGALTELKEYPDRSHSTFAQDGWEQVADYSLDWAVRTRGPNPPKMPQEILSHASITTTLDLCPGEMGRCVDRLNEAAGMSDVADDAAKNAADDDADGQMRCEDVAGAR